MERVREIKITVEIDTNKRTLTRSVSQGDDETNLYFIARAIEAFDDLISELSE